VKDAAHVEARTRKEWRSWLEENHQQPAGVWLVTYKKATGLGTLDYAQSVEEALCFGWIDSRPGKVDAQRSKLWFAPRKPKSVWSKVNKERVERLTAAGQMHAAGLEMVHLARRTGTWQALEPVDSMEIPADLAALYKTNPIAARNFDAFPPSAKKGILQWIQSAKTPATRGKRLQETVSLAARNLRANSWPRPNLAQLPTAASTATPKQRPATNAMKRTR
jgi:uncharacterized protein YdeI (YjbR/CyaY-like superfamily)